MNKKRKIILTSVILSVIIIAFGIVKLYQTYALSNNIDTTSTDTYNITITDNNEVTIPANSHKNVFYMVLNTNFGTVNYNIAYTGTDNITVKYYEDIGDSASGTIDENERKYIKLRITNTSNTSKTVTLSTILGYVNGGDLIYDTNNLTLVSESIIGNFANYITSLYTNATKSTITNNSITYNYANIYDIDDDDDTSGGLMNDRLGSNTTDVNEGNIRYYGAGPDNYVYFNCSDYNNQSSSSCEVWRIIGVFNGKVKLIRNESIGSLARDQDKNIDSTLTTYDNNWATSSLQVLLNEKYYYGDTTGTITYYSGETGSTSTNLNLSSIGIKNDITRNMISEETWSLLNTSSAYVYANVIYQGEISGSKRSSNPSEWKGKITIPYASDYAYATDLNLCTVVAGEYDSNDACITNSWLDTILPDNWFLNANTGINTVSWRKVVSGGISYNQVYANHKVFPTFYLDSNIEILSGTGSSTNPYKILI